MNLDRKIFILIKNTVLKNRSIAENNPIFILKYFNDQEKNKIFNKIKLDEFNKIVYSILDLTE